MKTTFGILTTKSELKTRKALAHINMLTRIKEEPVADNLRFTYKDGYYNVYVDTTADWAAHYHRQAETVEHFDFSHVPALQVFTQADEGDVLGIARMEALNGAL